MGAVGRMMVLAFAEISGFVPSPASADAVSDWRPFVAEASDRFHIPASWIERVMRAESGGHALMRGRPIVSRAGAMGLMQL